MGGTCKVLTVDEIVEINRLMIAKFGGSFFEGDNNLFNPGSLEYVLDEIQGSLFGREMYPSVKDKCTVLAWRIIAGHIFHDGNKRTGMEACRLMLELNDYELKIDKQIIDVAIQIADGKLSLLDFGRWVDSRTKPI